MNGSGGPTLLDSDTWKDILCSKVFGNNSAELCQTIADLAKRMCTEEIHPSCLTEYNTSRLIPLDKGQTKKKTFIQKTFIHPIVKEIYKQYHIQNIQSTPKRKLPRH